MIFKNFKHQFYIAVALIVCCIITLFYPTILMCTLDIILFAGLVVECANDQNPYL